MKKILGTLAIVILGGIVTTLAAPFTPGNLVVYRVGDGAATLTSAATPVFLDEYTTVGSLMQSIPLPTAVSGSNRRLTASGSSTSEGLMTLSVNGQFLMIPGYDADVGTAAVPQTASTVVNRVVGRVDASAHIDTTTALSDAYSGTTNNNANIRGATSTNGVDIWTTGTAQTSMAATAGSRYTTLGSTTSTQLSTTVTNLRATNIFGGQLYVSSGLATFRLGTVGTGTPTTSGQTITSLPGFPTATGGNPLSPYQFFFADLDGGVAGLDTLYVADDGSVANGGGIQKYSLVGGSWTANGIVALAGTRGLTGVVNGSSVTLYVTNGSTLQTLTDTSGYNVTINGTLASIAMAGTNTAFRGVAFVPAGGAPTVTSAVSQKTHGAAGPFDVDLPLTGTPGVEDRSGGATNDFTMIVTFTGNVTVTGSPQAQVTMGTGTIGSGGVSNGGMVTVAGNVVTVPLTNVADQQTINVTLNGVNSATDETTVNIVIPMSRLLGDTNGNRAVNASDVSQTKGRIGQAVTTANFRSDVNANGAINAGDVSIVKANTGHALP